LSPLSYSATTSNLIAPSLEERRAARDLPSTCSTYRQLLGRYHALFEHVEQQAPSERVLDPVPYEPLFRVMEGAGYDWQACNTLGIATQRTRPDGTPRPPLGKIDWFFSRGLKASAPATVAAVDSNGRAISDHEVLVVTVRP